MNLGKPWKINHWIFDRGLVVILLKLFLTCSKHILFSLLPPCVTCFPSYLTLKISPLFWQKLSDYIIFSHIILFSSSMTDTIFLGIIYNFHKKFPFVHNVCKPVSLSKFTISFLNMLAQRLFHFETFYYHLKKIQF